MIFHKVTPELLYKWKYLLEKPFSELAKELQYPRNNDWALHLRSGIA